jgi:glycosyltransferase involved in cell wall biosynthesis
MQEIANDPNNDIDIFPIRKTSASSDYSSLAKKVLILNRDLLHGFVFFAIINSIKILPALLKLTLSQKPKKIFYTLYVVPKALILSYLINHEQVEHLHAYWGSTPATCAYLASYLTSVKFSFTIHRADICRKDALALKTRAAQFVRSISDWGRQLAIKNGAMPTKIIVGHLGTRIPDEQQPKAATKTHKIVCASDLVAEKGLPDLIDAVGHIDNVKLSIFGEGPQKLALQRLVDEQNLQNKIELHGRISNSELLFKYKQRSFDLFILPSKIEGISVAAMEAMAWSIPVSATPVGGMKELINKENSYLLDSKLSNLKAIIEDIPNKIKLRQAYRKVKNDFNIKQTAHQLVKKIYETK